MLNAGPVASCAKALQAANERRRRSRRAMANPQLWPSLELSSVGRKPLAAGLRRGDGSHDNGFGPQPYAEALVPAGLDGARERPPPAAGRPATVDEHQGLLLVDACVADRLAFPAARVDQPAGGEL